MDPKDFGSKDFFLGLSTLKDYYSEIVKTRSLEVSKCEHSWNGNSVRFWNKPFSYYSPPANPFISQTLFPTFLQAYVLMSHCYEENQGERLQNW